MKILFETEVLIVIILIILAGIGLGVLAGYTIRKKFAEAKIKSAEEAAGKIIIEAKKTGDARKKEALLEAKDEIFKLRSEIDKENKERRIELQKQERRIVQKEENLDKKTDNIARKEESLSIKEAVIESTQEKINAVYLQQKTILEKIAGLSSDEARQLLLAEVEKGTRQEMADLIRSIEASTREEAEKKAREIISMAIQRCAADHVAETTVSVVALPSEEMKGRIIGREGRNIRTLENLTGIELIIDDTPEAVILSGFDPVRREVARLSLEKLISDGRIHPARIEETVAKAQRDVEQTMREAGEQAAYEIGVHGLHPEIIKLLGRLKYRTSFGQNVLKHTVEVAQLAGLLANELGVDPALAKRGGLLHDLGKAVDFEVEGTHIEIGINLAKKFGEHQSVINCIAAHHGDYEATSIQAVLVQAADAISAARPGARRETLEFYLKRLQKLEEIANSFEGVEKSFAIQAGREVRIIVMPDKIDDLASIKMSKEIAQRVEAELEYPGQIKVTVVRETRAVNYAK
ncbi:MAG: ribonuclease Y [Negativicutes bacterium]